MFNPRFNFSVLVFVAISLSLASTQVLGKPYVTGVRIGEHTDSTRLVLDISNEVAYEIFTLNNPYRVVIDFPEMEWRILQGDIVETRGLIKNFRYAQYTSGVSRVVLDLAGPVKVKRTFVLPPQGNLLYRFVIDLESTETAVFLKEEPLTSIAEVTPLPRKRPKNLSVRRIVVIDPGHGGIDPGAIGINGAFEKQLTLTIAGELSEELRRTGHFEVVMTRSKDEFIRLRERIRIARRAGGDLFISLHADSIKNPEIRGASVYTLSEEASDNEAAALAARENRADALGGIDLTEETDEVSSILIDLAQRETMNSSARYANLVVTKLSEQTHVLRNSHRFAGFAVLKGPDIPAVLVELGYLSNRADAELLATTTGRAKLVRALVEATEEFFSGG